MNFFSFENGLKPVPIDVPDKYIGFFYFNLSMITFSIISKKNHLFLIGNYLCYLITLRPDLNGALLFCWLSEAEVNKTKSGSGRRKLAPQKTTPSKILEFLPPLQRRGILKQIIRRNTLIVLRIIHRSFCEEIIHGIGENFLFKPFHRAVLFCSGVVTFFHVDFG